MVMQVCHKCGATNLQPGHIAIVQQVSGTAAATSLRLRGANQDCIPANSWHSGCFAEQNCINVSDVWFKPYNQASGCAMFYTR